MDNILGKRILIPFKTRTYDDPKLEALEVFVKEFSPTNEWAKLEYPDKTFTWVKLKTLQILSILD